MHGNELQPGFEYHCECGYEVVFQDPSEDKVKLKLASALRHGPTMGHFGRYRLFRLPAGELERRADEG